jgi:hypothetical protein
MKKAYLVFCCIVLFSTCKNKNSNQQIVSAQTENKSNHPDTTSNPKIDVKVNRKYDDKGNLIRFDSSYSYYYESPGLKSSAIRSDSLYRQFKNSFQSNLLDSMRSEMNKIFFNDSLFQYDFFNSDYFSKRFELNQKRFQEMFRGIDSLKSDVFKNEYPKGNIKKD